MHEMRRKDRLRDEAFCLELIDKATHGVMALTTGEDTPYCLPLSFARVDRSLYFHCARQGRKVDLMRACPRVCITFVGRDDPTYQAESNNFTTLFASAIVEGTVTEVTKEAEKVDALCALCEKLLPDDMIGKRFDRAITDSLPFTAVFRVDMDHISGKAK